jgi:hypothetical protein
LVFIFGNPGHNDMQKKDKAKIGLLRTTTDGKADKMALNVTPLTLSLNKFFKSNVKKTLNKVNKIY